MLVFILDHSHSEVARTAPDCDELRNGPRKWQLQIKSFSHPRIPQEKTSPTSRPEDEGYLERLVEKQYKHITEFIENLSWLSFGDPSRILSKELWDAIMHDVDGMDDEDPVIGTESN